MTPTQDEIRACAQKLVERFQAEGIMLACAESCTGGLIAAAVTDIAGSSAVLDRGFVTYSNQAKMEMLGVPAPLLDQYGAVSEPVARAMAEGTLRHSRATISLAVTGIAGPGGGTADKPVGTVHLAASHRNGTTLHRLQRFSGDRGAVRQQTVLTALNLGLELAQSQN